MSTRLFLSTLVGIGLFSLSLATATVSAQGFSNEMHSTGYSVDAAGKQIDLSVGTSKSIRFDFKIPELLVDSPEVVRATPVSANEIVISGLKPGVANITVSDPDKNVQLITVNVVMDVRKLDMAIKRLFPTSRINVNPLQNSVVLDGTVARANDVEMIMAVAKDFVPANVINKLEVDGSQVVAIEVKIYEVSRTKLRNMGVDWRVAGDKFNIVSGFSDVLSSLADTTGTNGNARFGIVNDSTRLDAFVNMLEKRNLAKLMASPTLSAQNGRPAEFLSGGEIPFQVSSGFGNNSIQFRPFGTKLDVVPLVHGEGDLTLEVRAEVSEVANDLSAGTGVPGFRVRRVNTGVPMRSGQTLALAGDYREKVEAEVKGLPHWLNKAGVGALVRNTKSEENETELVFILTPRIVNPVEAGTFADANMPGRQTVQPSNHELFFNGHIEVPRCEGKECSGDTTMSGNPNYNVPEQGMAMPITESKPMSDSNETIQNGFGYPQSGPEFAPTPSPAVQQNSGFEPKVSNSNQQYFQSGPMQPSNGAGYGYPPSASESSRQRVSQNGSGVRR